ncbi:MAG: response regulator [Microcoleaceae cyanobacterium]
MGTTFYLNILATSVSDAEVAPEHSRGQVIGLAANQPEYRILIVDDVATNRQLMNALLAPIGFQLREVANGLEAIQACETWHPHLVWMDMQMPVMDGYQATQKIKERSQEHLQDQAPVIIALTANALKQQEAEILAAGCDDIVAKPFREETIFAKMAEYLQVQYLYEETVSPPTTTAPTSESLSELTSANLQIMPAEWRAELHQAAIVGNDCRMQELVEQIPIEQAQLSNSLGHLVAEFDFERIIQLTQT